MSIFPSSAVIGRRMFLAALGGGGLAVSIRPAMASASRPTAEVIETAQTQWYPEPPQMPVTEGMAPVGGTELYYLDAGGSGEPVVLLHAYTGSAASWGYQLPVLRNAGFRPIAFSRRGHYRSGRGPADRPGRIIDDIHGVVDHLKLERFHLVGTAGGGFNVADYALSHRPRLLSMAIASSLGGIRDPDFTATTSRIVPREFPSLAPDFRELGPSYRAAYPEGVKRWLALEHEALTGAPINQATANQLTIANMASLDLPKLLLTGGADLYMPPSRMRALAARLPRTRLVIIPEAGHAPQWEQPEAFNRALINFLRDSKHRCFPSPQDSC